MTISPSKPKSSDLKQDKSATLSTEELRLINAYWRACNYLALGMIYLQDNPLLKESLKPEHIKNRLQWSVPLILRGCEIPDFLKKSGI